jgi:asparagine synthase (glutamine-hydrolysing)
MPVDEKTGSPGPLHSKPTYYQPTPFEAATGYLHGLLPASPLPEGNPDPVEALEDAILPALLAPPCYVTFSGGRDSSSVLAVATRLARREGLDDPIPVTEVYPDARGADESEWQHLVIEHLGIRNWLRITLHDDHDMIGPTAQDGLRTRGLAWPPAIQIKSTIFGKLAAHASSDGAGRTSRGSVLTGEGGDEVFGPHRATPLIRLVCKDASGERNATIGGAKQALAATLPRAARRVLMRRQLDRFLDQPWLQPEVRARHLGLVAEDQLAEPLHWGESVWWVRRRRLAVVSGRNHATLASEFGLRLDDPLLAPGFVASVARKGGRWGYFDRTEAMRAVFSGLLPASLLERRVKARFNNAYAAKYTRAFAESWDGSGLDPALIDAAALRAEWLTPEPSALTFLLLQQAWLATRSPSEKVIA